VTDQEFAQPNIQSVALMITNYALEHGVSPRDLLDIFNVGIAAASVLAPRLLGDACKPETMEKLNSARREAEQTTTA